MEPKAWKLLTVIAELNIRRDHQLTVLNYAFRILLFDLAGLSVNGGFGPSQAATYPHQVQSPRQEQLYLYLFREGSQVFTNLGIRAENTWQHKRLLNVPI